VFNATGFNVTAAGWPSTPIAEHPGLAATSPAVRAWFASSFPEPTTGRVYGRPPITAGLDARRRHHAAPADASVPSGIGWDHDR
jgi:hypothetical protein